MSRPDLHLALIQTSLHWEHAEANLEQLTVKISALPQTVDLVVLPEMFTTGFSMNPGRLAETMDGPSVTWMKNTAAASGAVICGSLMIQEGDRYVNRLIWMRPDGSLEYYDKRHLFGMGEENRHYAAGSRHLLVECNGWKIQPLICYDLRFPAWCRNTAGYDLLLFVANWPERRIHAWKSLLEARAIENQSYVVAVNRVGTDGHGMAHSGESSVIDPMGEILWRLADREAVHVCTLSHHLLLHTRERLPFLRDMDHFKLEP